MKHSFVLAALASLVSESMAVAPLPELPKGAPVASPNRMTSTQLLAATAKPTNSSKPQPTGPTATPSWYDATGKLSGREVMGQYLMTTLPADGLPMLIGSLTVDKTCGSYESCNAAVPQSDGLIWGVSQYQVYESADCSGTPYYQNYGISLGVPYLAFPFQEGNVSYGFRTAGDLHVIKLASTSIRTVHSYFFLTQCYSLDFGSIPVAPIYTVIPTSAVGVPPFLLR